jgi:SPP1 gp7 family putative phage head morphogenesis protein
MHPQAKLWSRAHRAENQYAISLRKIARHVQDIAKGFSINSPRYLQELEKAMRIYAKMLEPWARNTAQRMLNDVSNRNEQAWFSLARQMGGALRREIQFAPTGQVMQQLMQDQVLLITSLPLEASQRVHQLVTESLHTSSRGENVVAEIMRTGEVTKSRAVLIARTETARATSTLMQARAEHVGSRGYIWRDAGDEIVRASHQKMNGVFVPWGTPPLVEPGKRYHAGCFPNCRCIPDPVLPDIYTG